MNCPYGSFVGVGARPVMTYCPRGFPGCHCMDELLAEQSELDDGADAARNAVVRAFWTFDDEMEPDD